MDSDEDDLIRGDEEEEDDDDDDDDDLDDEPRSKKRKAPAKTKKKKKRAKNMSLFDDEAEDDDEDEDEDEMHGEDGYEDLDAEQEEIKRRLEKRMADRRAFEEQSVEALAQRYTAKSQPTQQVYQADDGEEISRNAFLPTMNDPKLFCVKVKPGEEKMLCLQLMNKYIYALRTNGAAKPKIFSAFWSGTKSFIYIEARTRKHCEDSLYGLRGIFRSKITQVPLKEMPSALEVKQKKKQVKVGDYVRLRRFPYKHDLARVLEVNEMANKLILKFVPRLDLTTYRMDDDELKEYKQKKIIPPKRFMNEEEVRAANGMVERRPLPFFDQSEALVINEDYFQDGYMIKEFSENMVSKKDIKPTLEELQAFRLGKQVEIGDEDDQDGLLEDGNILEELGQAGLGNKEDSSKVAAAFQVGDRVLVREGELQHLKGEVVSVDIDGIVKVNPLDSEVRGSVLDFNASSLTKSFDEGDHVKVLNGAYAGETGSVVKIIDSGDKWKAIVFTDSGNKEIKAFLDDLRISEERAQAQDSLKGYKLMDLVSLGTQVGIIVRIGSENMEVLLQTSTTRLVTPNEIRSKLNNKSKNTTAMDKARNPVQESSVVKVVAGERAGIEGTIKHIHRSFLFIHSRMVNENNGVFVERARNVQLAGVKLRNASGSGFGGAARGRGRGRTNRNDALLGKSVRIKSGRFKGYVGMAVQANEQTVMVEIHSKKKKVSIPRDKVVIVGDKNGSVNRGGYGSQPGVGQGGYGTPYGGSGGYVPPTPGVGQSWQPQTPGVSASDGGWMPPPSAVPTPGPGNYQPPPTPAGGFGGSMYGTTPAPVPPTPATPAVPQTPATTDADGSNDFKIGAKVNVIGGPLRNSSGTIAGDDGADIVVIINNKPNIINRSYLVLA